TTVVEGVPPEHGFESRWGCRESPGQRPGPCRVQGHATSPACRSGWSDRVPLQPQLSRRCFRVAAHSSPHLVRLPTAPATAEHLLPAWLRLRDQVLLREELDEVLEGGPKAMAADREVELVERAERLTGSCERVGQPCRLA